jgi:hypothetical protein
VNARDQQKPRCARTELADQDGLVRARRPLAVDDSAIVTNVETELLVALEELIVPALVLLDGIAPASEGPVALLERGDERLEVWVEREDRLRVERRDRRGLDADVGDSAGHVVAGDVCVGERASTAAATFRRMTQFSHVMSFCATRRHVRTRVTGMQKIPATV